MRLDNKETTRLQTIVGVRFRPAGKIYYFSPGGDQYTIGDKIIVETARGMEFGEVATPNRDLSDELITMPLKRVVRRATPRDEEQVEMFRAKEREAQQVCAEKIAQHSLPMSLVGAEYTFDGQKLIFYFTAENRVDFRELVRDLAATFKTRIELRQIGVRDEAKMLGGLGPCGRPICCATFLGEFQPVSIRMAKEQNLSLNPTKISGLCGRLMCCLRYECEHYAEPRPTLPEIGVAVLPVTLNGGREAEFPAEEVSAQDGKARQANGATAEHPCGRQQPADRAGRDCPERDE